MNGYTQITIDGVAVGLKFAYPAIKWFTEESIKPGKMDLYFTQTEDLNVSGFTIEGLAKLIECSYKNNCIIKEVEPVLKFEDFYNYVEGAQETEEGMKELIKVTEVYADSSVMKKIIDGQKKSQISP